MLTLLPDIFLGALQDDGGLLFTIYSITFSCCGLLFFVIVVAGLWQIFVKADRAGWKAIIPIYNLWVLLEIVGRPGWWIILFFIPFVNIVIWFLVALDLAKSFDHGTGFAIGLFLLPWLFYLILGWGEAQYYGPAAAAE
jgi:hypothetical protein